MGDALTFSMLWTLGLGTLLGLPLSLVLVHSALRSGTTERERRLRDLYRRVLEEDLHGERCLSCRAEVEPDWLTCPACTTELRGRCGSCDAVVKLHWSACPWCTAELAQEPEPALLRPAA